MSTSKKELINKALRGNGIDAEDITHILRQENPANIEETAKLASYVRAKFLGRQVCIHGIIEFSNFCRRNCFYCGLRSENRKLGRYRLEPDTIVELATTAVKKLGYKMLVLQSGEDFYYTTDKLLSILKNIFEQCRPLVFLSIGERDAITYEKLFLAGARGVLFRFETSSRSLYEEMHPGASFDERIGHLRFMRDIGYIIATGPLIGLPGQTIESYVSDILLLRDLGAHMVSMGPVIPHPRTLFAENNVVLSCLVQKLIIASRLALPRARIPITTAMEYLWGNDFRRTALRSGANSFMLNLTPLDIKDLYDIYPGKNKLAEHLHSTSAISEVREIAHECNMQICRGFGREFNLARQSFIAGCPMIR